VRRGDRRHGLYRGKVNVSRCGAVSLLGKGQPLDSHRGQKLSNFIFGATLLNNNSNIIIFASSPKATGPSYCQQKTQHQHRVPIPVICQTMLGCKLCHLES
jgi:hypothetical protein